MNSINEEIHKWVLENLSTLKDTLFDEDKKLKDALVIKWGKNIEDSPVKLSKDFMEKFFVIYEIALEFSVSKKETFGHYWQVINSIKDPIYLELSELSKNRRKRSRILGKWYNYELNKVEYELEDGNFVTIDGILRAPVIDTIWKILPDFVHLLYNTNEYRQKKLMTLNEY